MTAPILVEKSDGIAWLTLNRPELRNALTFSMCRELTALFEALRTDRDTRVLVLRGNGADFCSGADLGDVASIISPSPEARAATAAAQVRELSWPLFLALHELPQPVIASVRGHAVGAGMQLVLSSDLVVASETARFLIPQVRLAHSADHGESWYLPRKTGITRAMQFLLLGDAVGAQDAERYGLVNWVSTDDALEQKTDEIARRLASGAAVAIAEMKGLLRQSLNNSLQEQLEAEARALGACAATDDFAEAIGAFLAKRRPVFAGR
jgi:2-(1,2-epoxy-1,2-dihydrophenyl)acetyl-CoA isomerase